MGTLLSDVRAGLRNLAARPGFILIGILALALGIGANTVIFNVVNGVLPRPLPFKDSSQLVRIWEKTADFEKSSVS